MCNLKTLLDGTQVPNDSEAWRHECEAAAMLRMTANERKAHLIAVTAKRGVAEKVRLQDTFVVAWVNRQAEKLAGMKEWERIDRLKVLTRENGTHIMARIEARLVVVMERRTKEAANDNSKTETERAA